MSGVSTKIAIHITTFNFDDDDDDTTTSPPRDTTGICLIQSSAFKFTAL